MSDLISRSALLTEYNDFKDMDCPSGHTVTADYMIELAEDVPAVDAEPVRHGVWNENITFNKNEHLALPVKRGYICSLCGRKERKKEPYCNCGAKMMDGDVNEQ